MAVSAVIVICGVGVLVFGQAVFSWWQAVQAEEAAGPRGLYSTSTRGGASAEETVRQNAMDAEAAEEEEERLKAKESEAKRRGEEAITEMKEYLNKPKVSYLVQEDEQPSTAAFGC
eukprot:1644908-Rhodomonas_salina.3